MQRSLQPRMFWSFGQPKTCRGGVLGGGILAGCGDAFSRIGKRQRRAVKQQFFGEG